MGAIGSLQSNVQQEENSYKGAAIIRSGAVFVREPRFDWEGSEPCISGFRIGVEFSLTGNKPKSSEDDQYQSQKWQMRIFGGWEGYDAKTYSHTWLSDSRKTVTYKGTGYCGFNSKIVFTAPQSQGGIYAKAAAGLYMNETNYLEADDITRSSVTKYPFSPAVGVGVYGDIFKGVSINLEYSIGPNIQEMSVNLMLRMGEWK